MIPINLLIDLNRPQQGPSRDPHNHVVGQDSVRRAAGCFDWELGPEITVECDFDGTEDFEVWWGGGGKLEIYIFFKKERGEKEGEKVGGFIVS